jgi:hypothetical protein
LTKLKDARNAVIKPIQGKGEENLEVYKVKRKTRGVERIHDNLDDEYRGKKSGYGEDQYDADGNRKW